ncbi:unnamed protein product, partial [marine sediment metagenome]
CYSDDDEARRMSFEEILAHCLAVLGLNYRYGPAEQAALRLIDTGHATWEKLFQAAVDVPLLKEVVSAEKKTAEPPRPAPVSSTPGAPGSCPATAPAAPNCSSPAAEPAAAPASPTTT